MWRMSSTRPNATSPRSNMHSLSEPVKKTNQIDTRTRNESTFPQIFQHAIASNLLTLDGQTPCALRTDDELVESARSGGHEAFTELCRRHSHLAKQKIFGIVRHPEDAEDALQETLLRAFVNLRSFRNSSTFSTWITAIGINAALTVLRKKRSQRESDVPLTGPEDIALDIADQAPNPESQAARRQIQLLLKVQLQALPSKMREVAASLYEKDYSMRETAEELGLSVPAVKSRLLRARRSLRSSFKRKGLLGSLPIARELID
jgi:RNA polymerase sigma-70 factor (ECF subfamily)